MPQRRKYDRLKYFIKIFSLLKRLDTSLKVGMEDRKEARRWSAEDILSFGEPAANQNSHTSSAAGASGLNEPGSPKTTSQFSWFVF